jgi:hypothetical protein
MRWVEIAEGDHINLDAVAEVDLKAEPPTIYFCASNARDLAKRILTEEETTVMWRVMKNYSLDVR